jgi:G3E family GTPase
VLAGYFDAGKTTFINRVLRDYRGARLAVLVNDYAGLELDYSLVAYRNGEIIRLANGCVLCSMAPGLTAMLHDLTRYTGPPEHVLIEAPGNVAPASIIHHIVREGYRLDASVVVADAGLVRAQAAHPSSGEIVRRQLHQADIVLLNKTDRAGAEVLAATRAWLSEEMPCARIVPAVYAAVSLPLVLGAFETAAHGGGPDPAGDGGGYETWEHTSEAAVDEPAFLELVRGLPEGVLRGGGVLRLARTPDKVQVFRMVGKRCSLHPGAEPPTRSHVMLAGLPGSLDRAALDRAMQAVLR